MRVYSKTFNFCLLFLALRIEEVYWHSTIYFQFLFIVSATSSSKPSWCRGGTLSIFVYCFLDLTISSMIFANSSFQFLFIVSNWLKASRKFIHFLYAFNFCLLFHWLRDHGFVEERLDFQFLFIVSVLQRSWMSRLTIRLLSIFVYCFLDYQPKT